MLSKIKRKLSPQTKFQYHICKDGRQMGKWGTEKKEITIFVRVFLLLYGCRLVEYVLTSRSVNQFIHELPFLGQNFQSIGEIYILHFNVLCQQDLSQLAQGRRRIEVAHDVLRWVNLHSFSVSFLSFYSITKNVCSSQQSVDLAPSHE
jgi:hypothetical protein